MICPSCGNDAMNQETWDKVISHQGKSVTLHAVSGYRCSECGEAVCDNESNDRVAAASDALVVPKRNINPTGGIGDKRK